MLFSIARTFLFLGEFKARGKPWFDGQIIIVGIVFLMSLSLNQK